MAAPDPTLSVLQNVLCQLSDAAARHHFAVDLCLMLDRRSGWRLIMRHAVTGPTGFVHAVRYILEEYDVLLTEIRVPDHPPAYEFHLLPTLQALDLPANLSGS
jgi:hypothetical protein